MLSDLQKRAAQTIVNVFETSHVLGDYAQVTLLAGDTGHLTYGRTQTTLGSGNLADLIERYTEREDAAFARDLAPFLDRLHDRDLALDDELYFHNLLRAAADDPRMRAAQDAFFDQRYWEPALDAAGDAGIDSALGIAVVYDSRVHGSWGRMRRRTDQAVGSVGEVGERRWISAYVAERRAWLASHSNTLLHATVYRMDAFSRLIEIDAWDLDLPFVVRGHEVSTLTLDGDPPGVFSGPPVRARELSLTQPIARGLDVRRVQLALSHPDHAQAVIADGLYGPGTRRGVVAFQELRGLPPTGRVDGPVFDALRL